MSTLVNASSDQLAPVPFVPDGGVVESIGALRGRTILHLSYSDLTFASRIERQTKSAVEEGGDVFIAGHSSSAREPGRTVENSASVVRMAAGRLAPGSVGRKTIGYFIWVLEILFMRLPAGGGLTIHAHNLAGLLPALLLRVRRRAPVIYDCHELETHRIGWGRVTTLLAQAAERAMIPFASRVLVVSESIRQWYLDTYRLAPETVVLIRNLSIKDVSATATPPKTIRNALSVPVNDQLYVYIGLIDEGRSIETLLNVWRDMPSDRHLAFVGFGRMTGVVIAAAARQANVHYHPAVAPKDVAGFIGDADAGLCLIEDRGLSYRYSLPNKLFDYFAAGLAIIGSDLPEIKRVLAETGAGWVCDGSMESIRSLVHALTKTELTSKHGLAVDSVPKWQNEWTKLRTIYLTA